MRRCGGRSPVRDTGFVRSRVVAEGRVTSEEGVETVLGPATTLTAKSCEPRWDGMARSEYRQTKMIC